MHSIREGDRPDVLKRLAGHLFVLDLLVVQRGYLDPKKNSPSKAEGTVN